MMVIGITGTPLTGNYEGKTTCAKWIAEDFGFEYVDLMEPVSRVLSVSYGKKVKDLNELRFVMNHICAAGRQMDEDYWLNMVMNNKKNSKKIVLDNVYFNNEFVFVKNSNGLVISIHRGQESYLNDEVIPDIYLKNEGELGEFKEKVSSYLKEHRVKELECQEKELLQGKSE